MNKRVVIISDLHCGHLTGLTPPNWQINQTKQPEEFDTKHQKFALIQKDIWNFYVKTIKELQPISLLVCNGDLVDGHGIRSASSEQITTDIIEQTNIAIKCIEQCKAQKHIFTVGTQYHTSTPNGGEDFESIIANHFNASKIGSHEFINVNGLIFDIKHHVGTSQSPLGRNNGIVKDRLWNLIWNEHNEQPKANIIIRSHAHYFNYCGENGWLGMTTPALQGMYTKFGTRRCSGHVNIGLIHFDINEKGLYSWQPHIAQTPSQKAQVLSF